MSTATPVAPATNRILSMDQFRGYTCAGMFLVNFSGSYLAVKAFLAHGDGFFNYADSIMPSFMFCAGFSYRLTALRRFQQDGALKASWSYIRRSLALIIISLVTFGFGVKFGDWSKLTSKAVADYFFTLFKADLWETLAIIGVAQILILPLITRSFLVRLVSVISMGILYLGLNYAFDYSFQNGLPNWFDQFWGAHGRRAWDGGLFGPIAWSIPMLAGSLAYDVMASGSPGKSIGWFLPLGILLMGAGYASSCLTTLYDYELAAPGAENVKPGDAKESLTAVKVSTPKPEHAADPVWPDAQRWKSPGIRWAEPPFTPIRPHNAPPSKAGTVSLRQKNFWMMYKRTLATPFTLFSIGFALTLYSLFIVVTDIGGVQLPLFRTLGTNPLAGYVIHEATAHAIQPFAPKDSPLWMWAAAFAFFFWMTWTAIRYMERHKMFLRL